MPHKNEQAVIDHLSIISHDLKSPLNAINGVLQLIGHMSPDEDHLAQRKEIHHLVSLGTAAVNDMLQLINNILTINRLESGKVPLEPGPVNLGEMLESVLSTFFLEAQARKIHLAAAISANLPKVFWDGQKIRYHVINNIVSNALKFVPLGGTIQLSAHCDGPDVTIRVADNGPGIPIAERNKLFERYERFAVKAGRTLEGFGLGLYSASLFVKQHHGSIHVEDGLEGHGVTFVIRQPAQPFGVERYKRAFPRLHPICRIAARPLGCPLTGS